MLYKNMENKEYKDMIFISEVGRYIFRNFGMELMIGDVKKVSVDEFHNHTRKLVDGKFGLGTYDKYLKLTGRDGR